MKNIIQLLFIGLILLSCSTKEGNNDDLAKKRIKQYLDIQSMGIIKDVRISDLKKVDDSTYIVTCQYINPFSNKEFKNTDKYIFYPNLDSVKSSKKIKNQMKSEGEWINTNY